MIKHARPRQRQGITLPLSSLIDIVFLLLIYFLLTTNFMVDEAIDLKLPQARSASPQMEMQINVYVAEDGRVLVGRKEVPQERLFAHLKGLINGRRDVKVMIKADRRIVLNRAVKVMDLAQAAGAQSLYLATEKDF